MFNVWISEIEGNLTKNMRYRKLAHTDINVSLVCLGTMTWGEQNTEREAHEQLDFSLGRGVNFIDTAELYPVPPKKETFSRTETYIGNWFQQRKNRDKVILATKIAGRASWLSWIREGRNCFDRKNITSALEDSLKRLKTDYIDLYQLHWPDRKTNFFGQLGYYPSQKDDPVSIEETLVILHDLVDKGKIRYIGLSNETPWGVMEFLRLAKGKQLPKVVSVQNPYNLLNRTYEIGLAEVSHREGAGLLAYSPLAFGVLSGKYLNNTASENSRLKLFGEQFKRYLNENALAATKEYVGLADRHNISPAQMSLAFVNERPFLTSNIIGATNLEQLRENINSINVKLSKEILEEIENIHSKNPNPSP